jgi:hypothetical protein
MKLNAILYLLIILFYSIFGFSQTDSTSLNLEKNTDIVRPAMLPIHPLGIFCLRIAQNFKTHSPEHGYFNIGISNGNIWLPKIITFKPLDTPVQQAMENYSWYFRDEIFKEDSMRAEKMQISGDGVLQEYRMEYHTGFLKNHEIGIAIRAYRLSGKAPLSVITGDRFIEFFHKDILGINDPFKRSYHAYDSASINYTDEKGAVLEIKDGDFILPGVELNYYFYPNFVNKSIFANFGIHSGVNFSKPNSDIDMGFSATVIKNLYFNRKQRINIGVGAHTLKKNLVKLADGVNINDSHVMYGFEVNTDYNKLNKNGTAIHSFGVNYYYQSAYFSGFPHSKKYKYLVFIGEKNFRDWALASIQLYENIQTWRFIYSYTRTFTLTFYLEQDFKLNNAPDIQIGINLNIPLHNL